MKPVNINFSEEAKALVAQARLEAIDTGDACISGVHFLLADCRLQQQPSIKQFVFADDAAFKAYYATKQAQPPTIFKKLDRQSLPLTKAAEAMIKTAVREAKLYGSQYVEPHHLFLASCRNKDNLFTDSQDQDLDIYPRILAYYRTLGLQLQAREGFSFVQKIKEIFR
ncbi:hypothetical protein [Taibaiella chishuiensis]|uniref:Clp R domain-containing protein n=1 Tax=Taibaiella chishuiensis TaxID=1434707 RepID=A0A2P8CZG1_9BACT|nr:hypothetical protein [Taibaiella chishuiensis]PSK90368.1 hypothetical protein B0I18_10898 [Taibaiella chishuiensis]